MATKKEKQELVDILKFTPINVRMLIQGYGGEAYAGKVDRKIYDYFKEKKIDITDYASSWEEKYDSIPSELQPFPVGAPFECDNLFHASGAELSELNEIRIENADTGEVIWEHNMGWSDLEDDGVIVDQFDDVDFDDLKDGEVVFWGGQGEKGCFFDAEFTLRAPFDPKKLVIKFETCDGWHIVNYVEYDEEDLDGSGGYSTTGKWADAKWILGGDEEVYEPVDEEDDEEYDEEYDDDVSEESEEYDPAAELDDIWNDQKTEWFESSANPEHKGKYECEFEIATWPWPSVRMCEWTGKSWKEETGDKVKGNFKWRGLKFDPNAVS